MVEALLFSAAILVSMNLILIHRDRCLLVEHEHGILMVEAIKKICDVGGFTAVGHEFGVSESTIWSIYPKRLEITNSSAIE